MDRGTMIERVRAEIAGRKLVSGKENLLVAVSGGLDSMVLLHLLNPGGPIHDGDIVVAHFNHRLRGKASDADERLVAKTAKKMGLRFVTGSGDVTWLASKEGISIEMAARKLRHHFLAETAAGLGMKKIAVAHHADDQVELFFLRLLRGSGTGALGGMQWNSKSQIDKSITLIRPLLGLHKRELMEYARAEKIEFREDESNKLLNVQRNRIRNELLPLLKQHYQLALENVVLRHMETVRAENDFLDEATERYFETEGEFEAAPVALQRRHLQRQLITFGIKGDFRLIEKLRIEQGSAVEVDQHRRVKRYEQGRLDVLKVDNLSADNLFNNDSTLKKLEIDGKKGAWAFDNVHLTWEVAIIKNGTMPARKARLNQEFFDAEKVGGQVGLRHWKRGDRFQPLGFSHASKLQDLFVNKKVPKIERHRRIVAEGQKGEIIWVEGMPLGERFKLDKSSRYVLKWCWERL